MATKGRNSAAFLDSVLTSLEHQPAAADPRRQGRTLATPMAQEIGRAGVAAFERLALLERQIEEDRKSGRAIVEIEPARVRRARFTDRDPSFTEDEAFAELCRSIEQDGQLMPIAVREIADEHSDFETVWGHRRIAACSKLGRKVRAVILEQDDLRAAIFGYTENVRRDNTSLIEQGRFFIALIGEGLFASQSDLAQALQISEAQVSTAIRVAEIPEDILAAVGDWRRCTGRQALALRKATEIPGGLDLIRGVMEQVRNSDAGLKERVAQLCAAVRVPSKPPVVRRHTDRRGRHYAIMESDRFGVSCRFPKTIEAAFIEHVWQRLPELRAEFERDLVKPE